MAADPKIRIRMYRPGLGDCFLITFSKGAKKSHILIDCGRFNGSAFPGVDWPGIVGNIAAECKGRLDAVVVTHEHSDHISGFSAHLEDFRKMAQGELWLAWTEDPDQKILPPEKKGIQNLREAGERLQAAGEGRARDIGKGIVEVLGFSPKTDQEFEDIKALWPKQRRKLFDPGDLIQREWLFGVKVHVLGPPKDEKLINKEKGVEGVDMYHKLAGFGAAGGGEAPPPEEARSLMPFDQSLAWTRDRARKEPGFQQRLRSYESEAWRNVDSDWLESLQRMALQHDQAVNNTSLVLAFELPVSGDVLLFVGDAQVGNWQSWAKVEFKDPGTTAAQLLSRVVFYKCGHHGSHNATLKRGGLEAMKPGIKVAIPTNEEFALGRKPSKWVMPAKGLTDAMTARGDQVRRPDDAGVTAPYIDFKF